MSVQAGLWHFDESPLDSALLERVTAAAAQYGPDGESGVSIASLGMTYQAFHTNSSSRREHQPYVLPDGNILTWDGRLDNREDLIPQLREELRHAEATDRPTNACPTDVEIVAACYERWNTDCFRRLTGDWALALWDHRLQRLLLARDFCGIRHLYYHLRPGSILWSTNLAAIVTESHTSFTVSDAYVAGYMESLPEPYLTPYAEILAVPPGCYVEVRDSRAQVHVYWHWDAKHEIRYKTDAEYEEHFRQVFRQAVRRRLRADSPILAELSGGLDSSSIVCMADDVLALEGAECGRLDTLSFYSTEEPTGDERPYFTIIEQKRGRAGSHIDAGKYSTLDFDLPKFIPAPVYPQGLIAGQRDVSELMERQGNRVVLSGIGGDEFLGGVPTPVPELADLVWQRNFGELTHALEAWSKAKKMPRLKLLWYAVRAALPEGLQSRLQPKPMSVSILTESFRRRAERLRNGSKPYHYADETLPSRKGWIRTWEHLITQNEGELPGFVGCCERSYPYFDRNLLEFLHAVPRTQLIRAGQRRSLMRRALAGLVPHEVLWRKNKAVGARSAMTVFELQGDEVNARLNDAVGVTRGYLDSHLLTSTVAGMRSGQSQYYRGAQQALSLELWLRRVRDLDRRRLTLGARQEVFEAPKWQMPRAV
jgi:asparagine synthase (glutamine-hydrolysing)